jgi:hypothetical protein
LDDFFRGGKPRPFNAQIQKMCLPTLPPSSLTAQYLPEMKACDSAVSRNWRLPAVLIYAIFLGETSEKGKGETFKQWKSGRKALVV